MRKLFYMALLVASATALSPTSAQVVNTKSGAADMQQTEDWSYFALADLS